MLTILKLYWQQYSTLLEINLPVIMTGPCRAGGGGYFINTQAFEAGKNMFTLNRGEQWKSFQTKKLLRGFGG